MHSDLSDGDAAPPPRQEAPKSRRRSFSVWHVTGAAAAVVAGLLVFSLYRLDRTAVTVADVATGTTTAAAVQSSLGSTRPQAATPVAPAEQPARIEAAPAQQRDQGRLGPIIQGLLNPAPAAAPAAAAAPAVEPMRTPPTVQPPAARIEETAAVSPRLPEPTAPSSALEAAMARAEAAAVRAAGMPEVTAPLTVGARLPEPAAGPPAPSSVSQSVGAGSMRVFLHFTAGDPDERDKAERLARELRRRGVTVADIRPVRQSVRSSMIRFYHDSDRAQLASLAGALADAAGSAGTPTDWYVSDFTRYSAPPRAGNVEVWIPNG